MSESRAGVAVAGNEVDMVSRMRAVIPGAWFPITATDTTASTTPILDGLLAGLGCGWSYCYYLAVFVRQQTRLGTASGSFLDMICSDYFGNFIKRKSSELDDTFRTRITANLLIPRATRQAVIETLISLLNCMPSVFEPRRAADTGGYGGTSLASAGGGGGYGTPAFVLGSMNMPYQYMITVVSACSRNNRESEATFIDANGAMQTARRHVARPHFIGGTSAGMLTEARSFNLIKDSEGWTGLSQPEWDATSRWIVDADGVGALRAGHPVLQITVYSGGEVFGPTMTATAFEGPVTASLWLLLPVDHRFQSLSLIIGKNLDRSETEQALVDLTAKGTWQRLFVTFPPGPEDGGRVFMQLVGASEALMNTPILTQCWQIEPGSIVTSYISSSHQIGIREADYAVEVTAPSGCLVDGRSLAEAIGRAIPVGSIAWTAVLDQA